jgi:hypothetical protein
MRKAPTKAASVLEILIIVGSITLKQRRVTKHAAKAKSIGLL